MDDVVDFIPTTTRGSILMTTRNQHLIQPPLSTYLMLKCFSIEQASQFILKNVENSGQDPEANLQAARLISNSCGGLPLAVSQIVRYIRAFNVSIGYASQLCAKPDALVNADSMINQLNEPDYYHQLGLASLWDHSLVALSSECMMLAGYLSHLDPDAIPERFLQTGLSKSFDETFSNNAM